MLIKYTNGGTQRIWAQEWGIKNSYFWYRCGIRGVITKIPLERIVQID